MKIILTIIALITLNINVNSQNTEDYNSSIIHIVRGNRFSGSAVSAEIMFPNQRIFQLQNNSRVEYKIYSTGNIPMTCTWGIVQQTTIDIENNKEYYLVFKKGKFEEVQKEELVEEFEEIESVFIFQESLELPINRSSITSTKSFQPKQGTGFLINNSGYLLTNHHVIEGAKNISIKGIKGDFNTALQAKVVSIDRLNDFALLKIESKLVTFETPPYSIGSSNKVLQAEEVFALGYPIKDVMGEEIKVTNGIINSLSGFQGSISEFQFSASVQPGNSGGPLLDSKGQVIGIVTSKINSDIAESVGYAIKSDYIKFFLDQIGEIEYNQNSENNLLGEKELPEQVKIISNYVYIIETE